MTLLSPQLVFTPCSSKDCRGLGVISAMCLDIMVDILWLITVRFNEVIRPLSAYPSLAILSD